MVIAAALFSALVLGSAPIQDEDFEVDCENAGSTIEQNICAGRQVDALRANLRLYTDTAYATIRQNNEGGPDALIAEISEGERLWNTYVDAACGAVFTNWSAGTIRTVMEASCRMELIRERTHHIWREYLVTMEGSAMLPEPERSQYDYGPVKGDD